MKYKWMRMGYGGGSDSGKDLTKGQYIGLFFIALVVVLVVIF